MKVNWSAALTQLRQLSPALHAGTSKIPAGAFAYKGPCPPPGQQHIYEWTVKALDRNGKAIASATAVGKFPPR